MGAASQAPARPVFDRTADLAVATFLGFGTAVTRFTEHVATGGHAAAGRGETSRPDGG